MWKWTRARERAAALAAEDALSDEQIGARVHVTGRSIAAWKTQPEFRARIDELVAATREAVRAEGIANKRNRIALYNEMADKVRQVFTERAADPSLAQIPGGKTGLVVRTYKIANGRNPVIMEEFAVDTAALAELRQQAKQAAQELGEWVERHQDDSRLTLLTTAALLDEAKALGLVAAGDEPPEASAH